MLYYSAVANLVNSVLWWKTNASGKLMAEGWRDKKSPDCGFCAVIREEWYVYTYRPETWGLCEAPH